MIAGAQRNVGISERRRSVRVTPEEVFVAAQLTHAEMAALMARHDAAEAIGDVAAVMETVCSEPRYEFQPLGYHIRSREAVAEMYRRLLPSQKDVVKGAKIMNRWFSDNGYAVEYEFNIVDVTGRPLVSHVIVAFDFEDRLVQAERVFLGPEHSETVKRALGSDFVTVPGVTVER